MNTSQIFLIVKKIVPGFCPRFSPPTLLIPVLYHRGLPGIVMIGPEQGEINFGTGQNKTVELMEKIIADPAGHFCVVRAITDQNAAALFETMIANCQSISEEPIMAPGIKGLIREQFDQIKDLSTQVSV